MMVSFGSVALLSARGGFFDISELLAELCKALFASEAVSEAFGFLEYNGEAPMAMTAFFFTLSLFLCMFGERMFSLLRFLFLFAVGYVFGFCVFAPYATAVVPMVSESIIGVSCAILFAVLSKPVYYLFYLGVFGISAYILAGSVLSLGSGIAYTSAVCALILAFFMRRWAEVVITALLGAWGMCESVRVCWDFADSFTRPWLAALTVTIAVGFIGAVVQVRSRDRH